MARDLSIRIAVGDASGRHSAVWKVFTTNDEVYATHRTMGGVEKISFHSSRICRRAFVEKHKLPLSMSDRVLHRWTRAETLPRGDGQAVSVLTVFFPEAHLTPDLPSTPKKTIWLPPPSEGNARVFQMLFTRESEDRFRQLIMEGGQAFVAYHSLPNGEAIAIRSWANEFGQPALIVEASHGASRDLVLPSEFEVGLERPVGFTLYAQPDEMRCFELSGYWVDAGEARRRFPTAGTFSRTEIVDRTAS
jgi:hypothetical protein